jgi:hypothetical protein
MTSISNPERRPPVSLAGSSGECSGGETRAPRGPRGPVAASGERRGWRGGQVADMLRAIGATTPDG